MTIPDVSMLGKGLKQSQFKEFGREFAGKKKCYGAKIVNFRFHYKIRV